MGASSTSTSYGANSLDDLKEQININELADLIDIRRDGAVRNGNALYFSPVRDEKNASLSVFDQGKKWKDHATGDGGSCLDFVIYAGVAPNLQTAANYLHNVFRIPKKQVNNHFQPKKKSILEFVVDKCLANANKAAAYLKNERKISDAVIKYAIDSKTIGFNDYVNKNKNPGEKGYGGDAVAFICHDFVSKQLRCVEFKYINKALNGGNDQKCHGEKGSAFWCINHGNVKAAHTVVVVESPINALSIQVAVDENPSLKGWTAIATLGAENLNQDWSLLAGKRVISGMDNDEAGRKSEWAIHERLLFVSTPFFLLDKEKWTFNDINDLLEKHGVDILVKALSKIDTSLIPGINNDKHSNRLYLPPRDYAKYCKFEVTESSMSYLKEVTDRDGDTRTVREDVCGFRLAALSRIKIQSPEATMEGIEDMQTTTTFTAIAQSKRHGNILQKKVLNDAKLYNVEIWKACFGAIYKPALLTRIIEIFENAIDIGKKDAINFVGIAYKNKKLVVNQGGDCFFNEPEQQCPYHNLRFSSGQIHDVLTIINGYSGVFNNNAGLNSFIFAIGSHLKTILGFWPHNIIQAEKATGKNALITSLRKTLNIKSYSSENSKSSFRMLCSISHTSHPVVWEEFSTLKQDIIDNAVGFLQECYKYTVVSRGKELIPYLLSAPVMLTGEDVPVKSLLGKVVFSAIEKRLDLIPDNLPVFPMTQWLDFIVKKGRESVLKVYKDSLHYCMSNCTAKENDNNAKRIIENHAAFMASWRILAEFADFDQSYTGYEQDLISQMNTHLLETKADRKPWVWIMEVILSEIDSNLYNKSYLFEDGNNDITLYIRTSDIMLYFSNAMHLRTKYDASPVKSARAFKKQLMSDGVIINDDKEKQVQGKRCQHMTGISTKKLDSYGLSVAIPTAYAVCYK